MGGTVARATRALVVAVPRETIPGVGVTRVAGLAETSRSVRILAVPVLGTVPVLGDVGLAVAVLAVTVLDASPLVECLLRVRRK